MARYQVKRTFPSKHVLRRGQILVDPKMRNLRHLVNLGHLVELTDEAPAELPAQQFTAPWSMRNGDPFMAGLMKPKSRKRNARK
jgi:hypothetical protein